MTDAATAISTFMLLGMWAEDDRAADDRIAAHKGAFAPTVQRLAPTALTAMTDLIVAEWRRRYGDDDDSVSHKHRFAMRHEVRPPVQKETP